MNFRRVGQPINNFSRFWILAGSHVLFIVDHIAAHQPVTTLWNWVVNNREGKTEWQTEKSCLTIKRKEAAIKLFHGGSGTWSFPVHSFLHDAYHTEPNQLGEGGSGSSLLFRFTEKQSNTNRCVVHAIALDEPNLVDNWQLKEENNQYTLRSDTRQWTLQLNDADSFSIISGHNRQWDIGKQGEQYALKRHK